jgi:hypothetical protein
VPNIQKVQAITKLLQSTRVHRHLSAALPKLCQNRACDVCPAICKDAPVSQIANSNNEGVVCKKNKPVGSIADGFSCDLDFAPFPADSDYVTRCLGVNAERDFSLTLQCFAK